MTASFPIISSHRIESVFAVDSGRIVTAREYLDDACGLATALPPHKYIINLCHDRYRFAVGFAAALLRGQISLLPPSIVPAVIEQIAADFPDSYCLTDGGEPAAHPRCVAYAETRAYARDRMALQPIPSAQTAAVFFTSGSTGRPQPYERTWGALSLSSRAAADRLALSHMPDAWLVGTVPHQHSFGMESTMMLALQNRLSLCSQQPFFPADILSVLNAQDSPAILVTAPIHLRSLLAESGSLPKLGLIICATAPLSPQLALQAEARFSTQLFEIYGCSEAGQIATRRTTLSEKWQCLNGIELTQDSRGARVCGDSIDDETLLHDEIELCDSQTFVLHGRKEDLVNVAGKRSSLAHLNFHLNSIEGVRDGVFVAPDESEEAVPRLMAFVVAPDLTPEAILAELRTRIDPAFLPRPLRLVDSLPRNTMGKLPRENIVHMMASNGTEC